MHGVELYVVPFVPVVQAVGEEQLPLASHN
jgi:hypothetical protein